MDGQTTHNLEPSITGMFCGENAQKNGTHSCPKLASFIDGCRLITPGWYCGSAPLAVRVSYPSDRVLMSQAGVVLWVCPTSSAGIIPFRQGLDDSGRGGIVGLPH